MRRGGEDVEIVSTGCRPPSVPRPGRCREDVEIVSTGCRPPSVPRPPHTQEIVPVFSGGPFVLSRGGGQTGWHRAYSFVVVMKYSLLSKAPLL